MVSRHIKTPSAYRQKLVVLYDKELTHIIAPSLCPTHLAATALTISRNGQLHTYPAISNLRIVLAVE